MPESNITSALRETETLDARHTRLLAEAYGIGKAVALTEVTVVACPQPYDGPVLPLINHGSGHAYF